jgi:hypothetical protein
MMPTMPEADFESAYAPFLAELDRLRPPGAAILDAHTHLDEDEDEDEDAQSLTAEALLDLLDQAGRGARACAFPFHDPDRSPACCAATARAAR